MPPKQIKTQDVPEYVERVWGFTVSRITANNWMTKGLRNETLHTITIKNPHPTRLPKMIRITTDRWVDEFLTRCGVQPKQARSASTDPQGNPPAGL